MGHFCCGAAQTVRHRQDLYNNEMENAVFIFSSIIPLAWTSPFSSFFFPPLSSFFFLLMPSPENIPTRQVLFLQTAEAANCDPISKMQTCPSSLLCHSCLSLAVNEVSHTVEGEVHSLATS